MSSQSPEEQTDQNKKKTGPPRLKPLLKPKPAILPRAKERLPNSGIHGSPIKDATDSCISSPPPEIPSALKISQLTGPQPYGTRRPSLRRWVSGGGGELNQSSSPLSPSESPTFDLTSKVASHPVTALPRPFQSGALRKGLGPLLLTSRGWGEQRWQQGKDIPESDTASKSSSIASKDVATEKREIISLEEKPVLDTPGICKETGSFNTPILIREALLSTPAEIPCQKSKHSGEEVTEDLALVSSDLKPAKIEVEPSTVFPSNEIHTKAGFCHSKAEKLIEVSEVSTEKQRGCAVAVISDASSLVNPISIDYDICEDETVKPSKCEVSHLATVVSLNNEDDRIVSTASIEHDSYGPRMLSSKPDVPQKRIIESLESEDTEKAKVQLSEFKDASIFSTNKYLQSTDISYQTGELKTDKQNDTINDKETNYICSTEQSDIEHNRLIPKLLSLNSGNTAQILAQEQSADREVTSKQDSQNSDVIPVPLPRGRKMASKDHLQEDAPVQHHIGRDVFLSQHLEDRINEPEGRSIALSQSVLNVCPKEQTKDLVPEFHPPYSHDLQERHVDTKQYKKDFEIATEQDTEERNMAPWQHHVDRSAISETFLDSKNASVEQYPHGQYVVPELQMSDYLHDGDVNINEQLNDSDEALKHHKEVRNLVPMHYENQGPSDQNLSPQEQGLWIMHGSPPVPLGILNKYDGQEVSDASLSESFEYYSGNKINFKPTSSSPEELLCKEQNKEENSAASFPINSSNNLKVTFGKNTKDSSDHEGTKSKKLVLPANTGVQHLDLGICSEQPRHSLEEREVQFPYDGNISMKEVNLKGNDYQTNEMADSKLIEQETENYMKEKEIVYNDPKTHIPTVDYSGKELPTDATETLSSRHNVDWTTVTNTDYLDKTHDYYFMRHSGDYTENQPGISLAEQHEYHTERQHEHAERQPANSVEKMLSDAKDRQYIDKKEKQSVYETQTVDTRRESGEYTDSHSNDVSDKQYKVHTDQEQTDYENKHPVEYSGKTYKDYTETQTLDYVEKQSNRDTESQVVGDKEKQPMDYGVIQSVSYTENQYVHIEKQPVNYTERQLVDYAVIHSVDYEESQPVDYTNKQHDVYTAGELEEHKDKTSENYLEQQRDAHQEKLHVDHTETKYEDYTEKHLDYQPDTKYEENREKKQEVYIEGQVEEYSDQRNKDFTEQQHEVYIARSHVDNPDRNYQDYTEQQHEVYIARSHVDNPDRNYQDYTEKQHEVYSEHSPDDHTERRYKDYIEKHDFSKEREPEELHERQDEDYQEPQYDYTKRPNESVDSQDTNNADSDSEKPIKCYYELPDKEEGTRIQICPAPQLRLDGTPLHPSYELQDRFSEEKTESSMRSPANLDEIDETDTIVIQSEQPEYRDIKSDLSEQKWNHQGENERLQSEEEQNTGVQSEEAQQQDAQSEEPEREDDELEELPAENDFAFLEGTEVLDTSSLRCRASLGRKRCHRSPPSQTCTSVGDTDPDYWMFRDSTEPQPEKLSENDKQEEISPQVISDSCPSSAVSAPSPRRSHSKKGGLFSAITPGLLKGRLKIRSKSSADEAAKADSEEPKLSPKSPEKEKPDGHSLNWLHALKRKKKSLPK